MVDFNNETTIAKSPRDILIYIILERHYIVLQSIQQYQFQVYQNSESNSESSLKSQIYIYYEAVRTSLEQDKENHKEIELLCQSQEIAECMKGFRLVENYLYTIGVLKFGFKLDYDPSDAYEDDNAKHT